jgi:hypothetical protein
MGLFNSVAVVMVKGRNKEGTKYEMDKRKEESR